GSQVSGRPPPNPKVLKPMDSSDVARENHQVRPRNFPAILLLDRPAQPARLVQAHIVRPTIQRRKTLLTASAAAATVSGAVSAGTVPRHADKEAAVMAEICRPPFLRIRHQLREVLLHRREIE